MKVRSLNIAVIVVCAVALFHSIRGAENIALVTGLVAVATAIIGLHDK